MPSFTIHLAIAKKYLETHKEENKEEFFRVVIDPYLKDKATSHFGRYSSESDLNRYCKEVGLNSSYNKINQTIIDKYGLEVPNRIKELVEFESGETKILDFNSICKFIDTVGDIDLANYRIEIREEQEQEIK